MFVSRSSLLRYSSKGSKLHVASSIRPTFTPLRSFQSSKSLFDSNLGRRYTQEDDVSKGFPTENFKSYKKGGDEAVRKSYMYFIAGGAGMVYANGIKNTVFDFLGSMSPAADVVAMANVEVDLNKVEEGNTMIIKWRGKPLFIRHRNQQEIDNAVNTPMDELKDPQADSARVKKPEWLICLGVCTHLGCVPLANQGDYKGWFCPCHGSHYDTSGRIRKGPAPLNLEVPPYAFLEEDRIVVGSE